MKISRENLEKANKELRQDLDRHMLMCDDLANGRVQWIKKFPFSVGYSRLTGAAGGLIIIKQRLTGNEHDTTNVHYFEDFYRYVSGYIANNKDDEFLTLRDIMYQIKEIQFKAFAASEQKVA
jgi:hypothetical protein